jgi:hypothetical protein
MNYFVFKNLRDCKANNKKRLSDGRDLTASMKKGVLMNTLKNDTILGLERKYWYRRIAFIYLPFVFIFLEVYTFVVNFLLALGLR